MVSLVLGSFSIALYLLGTALLARRLRQPEPAGNNLPALGVAAGALALHVVVLYSQLPVPGGLQLGFFQSLSLAGGVMVLLMLLLVASQPVQNLGIAVLPIAALSLAGSLAWGGDGPVIATRHPGLDAHILISICAYGVLSLAALQALVLAFQHRQLHDQHTLSAVRGLPPLYVMEKLLIRMIEAGFVLLTAALATGFFFLEDMLAQHLAHKTVLSVLAWLLFATLLAGHRLAGWRGLTAVRFTLGGIVLLLLGYFGSKLVLEIILQRT